MLTVAADVTAASLTVTATSTVDISQSGTAEATGTDQAPVISAVTVNPATESVARGGNRRFTATVTGTSSPAQTVTWTLSGNENTGTTISANGTLTVAADETAVSLTVIATSTVDTAKSGTATVTLTGKRPSELRGFQIRFTGSGGSVNVSGGFKLSKSDTTYSSIAISVENDEDYDSFRWLVDGKDLSGDEESITLDASDYNAGTYQLTVIVEQDGVPYSREYPFAVID
jgi:membrane carboxypeptidase/penicillin-binding protein PbpC